MSLSNIGLLGVKAADTALSVTGNNIVNSQTAGFKKSRAQFADVYMSSSTNAVPGQGVSVTDVAQTMEPGSLTSTGRTFDVALNGRGFFITQESGGGDEYFTRSGAFEVDRTGLLKSIDTGRIVMGYAATNGVLGGTLAQIDLTVTGGMAAAATTSADLNFNLQSTATAVAGAAPATITPTDTTAYNTLMSVGVFDSLGSSHSLNMYMRKTANNAWSLYGQLDSGAATNYGDITFDTSGAFSAVTAANGASVATAGQLTLPSLTPTGGAADLDIVLDLSDITQFGSENSVASPVVDGNAAGVFTRYDIDDTGSIMATYSNGQSQTLAQIGVGIFPNQNALLPTGGNAWRSTPDSGAYTTQGAGDRPVSPVVSGHLEDSNVDMTSELVDLVDLQRFFSANARVIQTSNQTSQTVLQLR